MIQAGKVPGAFHAQEERDCTLLPIIHVKMLSEDQGQQTLEVKSESSSVFGNKFYPNTAMFSHLSIGCGGLCISKAELSNCSTDQMACKTNN